MEYSDLHPFHFFRLVDEKNHLDYIKQVFFEGAFEDKYSTKEEWIDTVDFDTNGNGYAHVVYFKDYIIDYFKDEKIKSLELLDKYLIGFTGKEVLEKLNILKSTWVLLKERAGKNTTLKKYKLNTIYNELTEEINRKHIFLSTKEKQSPYTKGEKDSLKSGQATFAPVKEVDNAI